MEEASNIRFSQIGVDKDLKQRYIEK